MGAPRVGMPGDLVLLALQGPAGTELLPASPTSSCPLGLSPSGRTPTERVCRRSRRGDGPSPRTSEVFVGAIVALGTRAGLAGRLSARNPAAMR